MSTDHPTTAATLGKPAKPSPDFPEAMNSFV
jgi:hypothetical protein